MDTIVTILAFTLMALGMYLVVVTALRALSGISASGSGELKPAHVWLAAVSVYAPGLFGIILILTGFIILLSTHTI